MPIRLFPLTLVIFFPTNGLSCSAARWMDGPSQRSRLQGLRPLEYPLNFTLGDLCRHRGLEYSASTQGEVFPRRLATRALRLAAERRRNQLIFLPAARAGHIRALGRVGAPVVPICRQNSQAHFARAFVGAIARAAHAISRRNQRARIQARAAAASTAAVFRIRRSPRRPVFRALQAGLHGSHRVRTPSFDVGDGALESAARELQDCSRGR